MATPRIGSMALPRSMLRQSREQGDQDQCPHDGACEYEGVPRLVFTEDRAAKAAPEPDFCRFCARALSSEAKALEAERVVTWLQRIKHARAELGEVPLWVEREDAGLDARQLTRTGGDR